MADEIRRDELFVRADLANVQRNLELDPEDRAKQDEVLMVNQAIKDIDVVAAKRRAFFLELIGMKDRECNTKSAFWALKKRKKSH